MTHYDKPKHQRWLYRLADKGLFKAIIIVSLVCLITIGIALITIKAVISHYK